eukprot:TRINITY_DN10255_c0_g1_i3.p1 TRINITY_DN10255_c0_g1~~TRINITY_DN10255_c0_g1_i3.p1  ORF type:complete len:138 (+),score=4.45 TRINITY_DN10255_c0_g1_i3:408-821(+)
MTILSTRIWFLIQQKKQVRQSQQSLNIQSLQLYSLLQSDSSRAVLFQISKPRQSQSLNVLVKCVKIIKGIRLYYLLDYIFEIGIFQEELNRLVGGIFFWFDVCIKYSGREQLLSQLRSEDTRLNSSHEFVSRMPSSA